MNSIAQQAVPNGKGQKELRCAHSSSVSNFVVSQLSPVVSTAMDASLPASSLALVPSGHKQGEALGNVALKKADRIAVPSVDSCSTVSPSAILPASIGSPPQPLDPLPS